ncbi:MAG: SRPBCC family protein [Ramlibacter sp.]|nr:SRPBCC family protein [Ramlibacter sp.]
MASIRKEFTVRLAPAQVWGALKDFGSVHQVLASGFVTSCVLEQEDNVRTVTFANGMTARERLVTMDDSLMRLVYTVEGGRASHHNACVQVVAHDGGSRVIWITDALPDSLAPTVGQMMDAGARAMTATLDRAAG